ncbi:hypothetical protein NC652_031972 [Populus alba x Populus x berolinensis]|nr:hypothetical protein NC652_031972 [Populus alba x Populus x berolinensis]
MYFPLHHNFQEKLFRPVKKFMTKNTGAFVGRPPKSKTKERPLQQRKEGGKEMRKQIRAWRPCKHAGRNITTCPGKENVKTECWDPKES